MVQFPALYLCSQFSLKNFWRENEMPPFPLGRHAVEPQAPLRRGLRPTKDHPLCWPIIVTDAIIRV